MSTSKLNRSTVSSAFFQGLEADPTRPWVDAIARRAPSDTKAEVYAMLGAVPRKQERNGDVPVTQATAYDFEIRNKEWESALEISRADAERDQTGMWDTRVGEMGTSYSVEDWEYLVTLMNAGESTTAYDEQNFFSATHSLGKSGTQINLLTNTQVASLDITTATAPTPEEFARSIVDVIGYMHGYRDSSGRLMNRNARSFMVVCNTVMAGSGLIAATANNLQSGQTNYVTGIQQAGYNIQVVADADWSDADAFGVFRTDSPSRKPFIVQEEVPVDTEVFGPGSEYYRLNHKALVTAYSRGNYGVGEPLSAAKATFS